MLNISYKYFSGIGTMSLMFMVYSGYLKWIPGLFMDPFIFFLILLVGVILFSGLKNIFRKESLIIIAILIFFFIWTFISVYWGISEVYFKSKIQKSFVILACFISPFFVLRTEDRIKWFIYLFYCITFLIATLLVVLYIIYEDIFYVFYNDIPFEESKIPDYLALGILLASGFILAIRKTGKIWLIYKAIILVAIILLAPRGPIITLGVFIVYNFITNGLLKKNWYKFIYPLVIGIIIFHSSEGLLNRVITRFSGITENNSYAFSSVSSRLELANSAIKYFQDSPIAGVGYGSFGKHFNGMEDLITPHNIFLEIAAETGTIGLILFLIFIFSTFYFVIHKKTNGDKVAISLKYLTLFLFVQSITTTYLVDSKALFLWLGILICYLTKPLKLYE